MRKTTAPGVVASRVSRVASKGRPVMRRTSSSQSSVSRNPPPLKGSKRISSPVDHRLGHKVARQGNPHNREPARSPTAIARSDSEIGKPT